MLGASLEEAVFGTDSWGPFDACLSYRWGLPVLSYHSIRGNNHYPFLGVIVLVILHDFIRQTYHKNQSDRYPFFLIMVNYPIFLLNYHILYGNLKEKSGNLPLGGKKGNDLTGCYGKFV